MGMWKNKHNTETERVNRLNVLASQLARDFEEMNGAPKAENWQYWQEDIESPQVVQPLINYDNSRKPQPIALEPSGWYL